MSMTLMVGVCRKTLWKCLTRGEYKDTHWFAHGFLKQLSSSHHFIFVAILTEVQGSLVVFVMNILQSEYMTI
jgi:hypothetical protein